MTPEKLKATWDELEPVYKIGAAVAGAVIFLFSTFVTVSAFNQGIASVRSENQDMVLLLKDQNKMIKDIWETTKAGKRK